MRQLIPFRQLLLTIAILPTLSAADGGVPGWNRFVYLIYKLEVTGYCQLTTEQAGRGYQAERSELIDEYGFSEELISSAQAEAWKLAYKEWDNRGLGGFRGWCRNDGQRYLAYLEESYRASREPGQQND